MKKQFKYISVSIIFLLLLQLFVFVTASNAYAAEGTLRVQMYMGSTSSTTNQISPRFKIYNDSTSSIDMSNVKLRYYYTKDSSTTQNFVCDSFLNNNIYTAPTGITGTFTDMPPLSDCDNYLEIGLPTGVSLAANTCIELQTRIHKSDYTNYDQSNDYSFDSTSTTYVDWDKVTAYTSDTLSWGVDPNVTPDKGFLVIVSSKIIDYCSAEVNQYMSDISGEGWSPTLITVNNEVDVAHPDALICETAQELKGKIKTYYNQGYEGFVLIGSAPSIPTAKWKSNPSSTEIISADLFYADMDDWCDIEVNGVSDGIYESYYDAAGSSIFDKSRPANPSYPLFIPEMIYGRISAGAISNFDPQLEGTRTAAYLSKIHNFRSSGWNADFGDKAFCFFDDEFLHQESDTVTYMRNLAQDIYCISNMASSDKDTFLQFLQGGYRMGYGAMHGNKSLVQTIAHPNGTEDYEIREFPAIADINEITVKVNYLHLNSCSTCNYDSPNLGATILFNNANSSSDYENSYVCNVTGQVTPGSFNLDADYYEDLKSNCIGTAFKNFVSINAEFNPMYILLGDPTLQYNFTEYENKCPYVTNDLHDVNAYPDKPFKITFQTTDPENDPVFVDVAGLPNGATYDSSTKTLDWVPSASQVGNSYNVTITAYNKDALGATINKYVQSFTIYVSRMTLYPVQINNPGFESLNTDGTTPSSWIQWRSSYSTTFSIDPVVKYSGNNSACITNTQNTDSGLYGSTATNVEPNTHYLLSGYIKTSNAMSLDGAKLILLSGAGLPLTSTSPITGTQDWTPVYIHWYSGDNTSLQIQCFLTGSGTAWFDDIKLERDDNLGFELVNENFSPSSADAITNWTTYSLNQDSGTMSQFWLSSDIKYSGLRSGLISSNQAPNYAYLSNEVDVVPNASYLACVWIRTSETGISGDTGAYLELQCGDETAATSPVSTTYGDWMIREVYITTGTNTKMTINCKLGDTTDLAMGTAWFDNIKLYKISGGY